MRIKRKTLCFILSLAMLFTSISASALSNSANIPEEKISDISVKSKLNTDGATFSWDNATVYFLLTDRFYNGDTSNDHSYNRGLDAYGNVVTGIDESATFHGGDFAGITKKIEEGYFDELGVNALWISAPYEQIHGYVIGGDGDDSFAHYAYHGYYVLDYTQTDANFGTKEEFQTLVDTAHEHGIRIVLDIVMNHTGYNTLYDMNEYGFGDLANGWEDYYFSFKKINNTNYHSYVNYEENAQAWAKWWGPDWIRSGLAGYTSGGGDNYTQSLAGLPDFKTESTKTVDIPNILKTKWIKEGRFKEEKEKLDNYFAETGRSQTVTNYLAYWISSWVREFGVDGFRCDTAKHVDLQSWAVLKETCVDALREWKAENPDKALDNLDFWMTGEVWDHGVYKDDYYTVGGFDSIINFSTQGGGLLSSSNVKNTYSGFAASINSDDEFNVLSYISSHDSVLCRNNMISTGSAFLLLPGAVQIFYGDETERPVEATYQTNGDHEVRGDMNWNSMNEETLNHWQTVGKFRNNHISVGGGTHTEVNSSSGFAFTRVYDKNDLYDAVCACIYAGKNKDVTIDVSSIWKDGQLVVNAYDNNVATVTDGKVTFNSGSNGTILLEEPNGLPLMSLKGASVFYGTEEVTINLIECDSAKVSVDGGKKFLVNDGDTFTIGETAYPGDIVKVTVEATNEAGYVKRTFTFTKSETEIVPPDTSDTDTEAIDTTAIIHVKMEDGSAPYVYAWTGTSTAECGEWPGTKLTETDSDGWFTITLDTTDVYNIVVNTGGDIKTSDIKNLCGEVWVTVSSDMSYKKEGGDANGSSAVPEGKDVIIHVKPYGNNVPYLYVWNENDDFNGGFPGRQMTEKDEDGWYVYTAVGADAVCCIVSDGTNQNQSSDITGLVGDVWIEVKSESYKDLDITRSEIVVSGLPLLKQTARSVKNMTPTDFTSATWNQLFALIPQADALIALGEEASLDEIDAMIEALENAMDKLVLAAPVITSMIEGASTVAGTAPNESVVYLTMGGKNYSAVADDVTGEWSIQVPSVESSASVYAERNGIISDTTVISSGISTTVSKSALAQAINDAYKYVNGSYTEDSLTVLSEKLSSAEAVYNNTSATQIEVDNAASELLSAISNLVAVVPEPYKTGDVNNDNYINMQDVVLIQKQIVHLCTFNDLQQKAADVNNDNYINMQDVVKLQRYIAGIINEF